MIRQAADSEVGKSLQQALNALSLSFGLVEASAQLSYYVPTALSVRSYVQFGDT